MTTENFQSVIDWLIDGARSTPVPNQFLAEMCERLVRAGMPLWRVGIFVRTLHPNVFGRNFIWRPGEEVVVGSADFDIQATPEFINSPLAIVFREGREVSYRLDDPESARFPFFDDMRAEGVTGYIALPLLFIDGSTHASSWTTKQPGGFSDAQLEALRTLARPLARLAEAIGQRRIATTLLETYVGARAGEKILAGQIRRGHTETMRAVIWLSDLRGFTKLSDRLSSESVVEILNLYFECQVPAIVDHGGEVLKFMGDGLLAVFPVGENDADVADVCGRVLAAAHTFRENVDAMRYESAAGIGERFRFGLALHVGRVLYGNIGGGNRLDFTCIGPAVNMAARIEKIASRLNRTILASTEFVRHLDAGWTDLGEFAVAGFSAPERVYGLLDEISAAQNPVQH